MAKKKASERFFSVMYVPDQEKDPRSFSLNYLQGRLILAGVALLFIHVIGGVINYVRLYQLNQEKNILIQNNQELESRNRRIEPLIVELKEMKSTVDKIRRGFGNTLGIEENISQVLNDIPDTPYEARNNTPSAIANIPEEHHTSDPPVTNYFLFTRDKNYYDPEYMPTRLPVEGYLTTHFQTSSWYHHRSHQGIDIAAEKGALVHAAGSGYVILSNWTPDFGHVIIIAHGNGYYSYYGHAMRLLVSQGNFVEKGQQIALLGSSGISSAPHLHFEIWKDGIAIDPEDMIRVNRDKKEPTES